MTWLCVLVCMRAFVRVCGSYDELDAAVEATCGALMLGDLPGESYVTVQQNTAVSCTVVGQGAGDGNGATVDTGLGFSVLVPTNSGADGNETNSSTCLLYTSPSPRDRG